MFAILDPQGQVARVVFTPDAATAALQCRPGETARPLTEDELAAAMDGPCALVGDRLVACPTTDEERTRDQARQARMRRDAALANTDWTQVPDAPVDRDAWRIYRRALRELTKQAGFPHSITWPERPEA